MELEKCEVLTAASVSPVNDISVTYTTVGLDWLGKNDNPSQTEKG